MDPRPSRHWSRNEKAESNRWDVRNSTEQKCMAAMIAQTQSQYKSLWRSKFEEAAKTYRSMLRSGIIDTQFKSIANRSASFK